MTSRLDVRRAFKAIGYSISFRTNPLNRALCNIAFKGAEMAVPAVVSSGTAYAQDFYQRHEPAFQLAHSFKNVVLSDTAQKVVL